MKPEVAAASAVPLMINNAVVGLVQVTDTGCLETIVTTGGTQNYLKEMLMTNSVASVSLSIDYVEQEQSIPTHGHLRLVREH